MADVRHVTEGQSLTLKTAAISAAAAGDNTLVSLVSGKLIKVYSIVFVSTGTVNMKFKSGASTDLTGDMNFQAREGFTLAVAPPAFLLKTAAGEAFVMNLSAAIATDGFISYWDDDGA